MTFSGAESVVPFLLHQTVGLSKRSGSSWPDGHGEECQAKDQGNGIREEGEDFRADSKYKTTAMPVWKSKRKASNVNYFTQNVLCEFRC